MERVDRYGNPVVPLNVTPTGRTSRVTDPYSLPTQPLPIHSAGSQVQNKQVGPFFWDAGYGRPDQTTPFNLELRYELDVEALKEWALDHAPALAGAGFVGCSTALVLREPERYTPVIEAFGNVLGNILSGVGEIIPG